MFSGNAYFRYIRADTVNPNLNTSSLDESVYQPTPADQAALAAAGYTGFPTSGANASNTPFPYWRCIAQTLHAQRTHREMRRRYHQVLHEAEQLRRFLATHVVHLTRRPSQSVHGRLRVVQ
jgi:hypothetical protein